jgi:hypothetical protein
VTADAAPVTPFGTSLTKRNPFAARISPTRERFTNGDGVQAGIQTA